MSYDEFVAAVKEIDFSYGVECRNAKDKKESTIARKNLLKSLLGIKKRYDIQFFAKSSKNKERSEDCRWFLNAIYEGAGFEDEFPDESEEE